MDGRVRSTELAGSTRLGLYLGMIVASGLLLPCACGGRAVVESATPPQQTGGSVSVGGTSTGTGGAGLGGASGGFGGLGGTTTFPDCVKLFERDPRLELAHGASEVDQYPELVATSDDSTDVSMAFVRSSSVEPYINALDHVSFAPWGAWPPSLGPVSSVGSSSTAFPAFALGGSFAKTFALLAWWDGPTASFMPNVKPNESGTPMALSIDGWNALFSVPGPTNSHLVGTATELGGVNATIVEVGSASSVNTKTLACAGAGAAAAAVATDAGWLVAAGSAMPSPGLGCNGPSVDPAQRIDVLRVSAGSDPTPVASLTTDAPPTTLAAAPAPSGIYVVWIEQLVGTAMPARWARVDVSGTVVGPFDLTPTGVLALDVAATSLGERLAVAITSSQGGAPTLTLAVRDSTGSVSLDQALDVSMVDAPTMLGGPNGKSLLLAWGPPTVGLPAKVMRLDCVGQD